METRREFCLFSLDKNGIKSRYNGFDKEHKSTHSNAQLAKEAVLGLFEYRHVPTNVTLMGCGEENCFFSDPLS